MPKEARTTPASRFKPAILGVFILLFASSIFVAFINARVTSASLKVLGFGTNQCGDFVLLQLTNAGPRTIVYSGSETNEPLVTLVFQTRAGRRALDRCSCNANHHSLSLDDIELKPRQSVEFRVLTSDMEQDFRVSLPYAIPIATSPLDWLAYRAYRISGWDWLCGSHGRAALTPLITTNSQLARMN